MKFFAFIFLATLRYVGEPEKTENLFSYQLQFQSYDQCVVFYNEHQANILNGLLEHGRSKFGDIEIDYLACAEVEITPSLDIPNVLGQRPVYERQ